MPTSPKSQDEYRELWDADPRTRTPATDVQPEAARVTEVRRSLKRMLDATGDAIFRDALTAIEVYGFRTAGLERGSKKAWSSSFGDPDVGLLNQIRFNVEVQGWTIPASCQEVVTRFGVSGASFDAAWDRLARAFRIWKRAGFQAGNQPPPGDLGDRLRVYPADDVPLQLGSVTVPLDGLEVPNDSFWRRRASDGSVKVLRLKD